jgi:hypothetical protein
MDFWDVMILLNFLENYSQLLEGHETFQKFKENFEGKFPEKLGKIQPIFPKLFKKKKSRKLNFN